MSYPFSASADEFKGKRVLVTGGTKGMGALIVERFVASGASVATTARSPLPADQRPTLFIQADIGSSDGTEAVIEGVNREWGGIDILINCVGGSEAPNGGFSALSDEDWSRALDVNLLAAVRMDRALIPGMIARSSASSSISTPSSTACRFTTRRSPMPRQRLRFARTPRASRTKWGRRECA